MLILVSKLRFEPLNTVNFRFSIFQKMDLKQKQFDTLEKTFFLKFDIFEWIFTTPILFCFDDFFCCNVLFDTKRQKSEHFLFSNKKKIWHQQ